MNNERQLSSFTTREATAADVSKLAALHVETFHETHGFSAGAPTYETRYWQWQEAFKNKDDSWFCFVIENERGDFAGFAKGQPYNHTDLPGYSGELNKIYLLKKYHKNGLGRLLLYTIACEFLNRGIHSMLLFGDAKNPSNGFYERMGAEKIFSKSGEFHGGYGWKDLQKLVAIAEQSLES